MGLREVILWDVEAVRFLMGRMRHRMLLLTTFDQAKDSGDEEEHGDACDGHDYGSARVRETWPVIGRRVIRGQGAERARLLRVKGYEDWHLISISQDGPAIAAIMGNPTMIKAYEAGIPGNGKPFPDGSKMAKVHWVPTKMATFPAATVPGRQHDVDFMVKDSKRFQDSGGWGWGAFELDSASGEFTPATMKDTPPQGNDAKCGFACHTVVQKRDFVFTDYAHR